MDDRRTIAYFPMEIGLDLEMPTYSGGLGILAGDTIRSAADLKVPMVGCTLLHRKGYFYQRLEQDGWQREEPYEWVVNDYLEEMPVRSSVTIEERTVQLRAWKYEVSGVGGYRIREFRNLGDCRCGTGRVAEERFTNRWSSVARLNFTRSWW